MYSDCRRNGLRHFFANLLSLCLASSSLASQQPFQWPESYSVTITERSQFDPDLSFVSTFRTNGKYSRTENAKFGTSVVRPDQGKEFAIQPDGSATVRRELPSGVSATDLVRSYFYPKDGTWQKIGDDIVNGRRAVRYRVDDKYRSALFWVSSDQRTPVRYEEGNAVVEFFNYSAGPLDSSLFDVPNTQPPLSHQE